MVMKSIDFLSNGCFAGGGLNGVSVSPTARKTQQEPAIGKTNLVSGDLPSVTGDLVILPYLLTLEGLLAFRGHCASGVLPVCI